MVFLDALSPALSQELAARLGISERVGYLLAATLAVGGSLLVAFLLKAFVLRGFHALAARSRTKVDDIVADALRGPVYLFALLVGACLAVLLTPAPATLRTWAPRLFIVFALAGLAVFGARVLAGILNAYGGRAFQSAIVRALVRRLVVLVVYTVGFLLILDNLGLRITPLITTLGLAGLAVALALQDTLANFFAGLWVQADRPIDVGHYVRVEAVGVEGFVEQVGWRTTKIRTLPNNQVVIPNATLASSVVVDYDLPTPDVGVSITMSLPPGVDTRRVEDVLLEEARRGIAEIPGMLASSAPFVRFNGYTQSGLDFALHFQVRTFVDQYAILHEMRHRVHARLGREGIAPSFPIRRVRVDGEDASAAALAPE